MRRKFCFLLACMAVVSVLCAGAGRAAGVWAPFQTLYDEPQVGSIDISFRAGTFKYDGGAVQWDWRIRNNYNEAVDGGVQFDVLRDGKVSTADGGSFHAAANSVQDNTMGQWTIGIKIVAMRVTNLKVGNREVISRGHNVPPKSSSSKSSGGNSSSESTANRPLGPDEKFSPWAAAGRETIQARIRTISRDANGKYQQEYQVRNATSQKQTFTFIIAEPNGVNPQEVKLSLNPGEVYNGKYFSSQTTVLVNSRVLTSDDSQNKQQPTPPGKKWVGDGSGAGKWVDDDSAASQPSKQTPPPGKVWVGDGSGAGRWVDAGNATKADDSDAEDAKIMAMLKNAIKEQAAFNKEMGGDGEEIERATKPYLDAMMDLMNEAKSEVDNTSNTQYVPERTSGNSATGGIPSMPFSNNNLDTYAANAQLEEKRELDRRDKRNRLLGLVTQAELEDEIEMEGVRKETAEQISSAGEQGTALGGFMGLLNQISIDKRKRKEEERRQTLIQRRAALDKMSKAAEQHSGPERNLLNAYSPETIKKALDEGAAVDIVDEHGHSPLVKAALSHRFAVVKYLFEKGANPNFGGMSTPLQMVTGYDLQMALTLCLKGANPNIAKWGDAPKAVSKDQKLHLFDFLFNDIGKTDSRIRKLLAAAPPATDGATALNEAVINGDEALMNKLLDEGVAVDSPNEYSWTPLMQAAQYGKPQLAKALLARGANIDAVNIFGQTPLGVAWSAGYGNEIMPLLIANGANVKIKDITGKTVRKSIQSAPEWMRDKSLLKLIKLAEKNPSEAAEHTGITPVKRTQPLSPAATH